MCQDPSGWGRYPRDRDNSPFAWPAVATPGNAVPPHPLPLCSRARSRVVVALVRAAEPLPSRVARAQDAAPRDRAALYVWGRRGNIYVKFILKFSKFDMAGFHPISHCFQKNKG